MTSKHFHDGEDDDDDDEWKARRGVEGGMKRGGRKEMGKVEEKGGEKR